MSLAYTPDRLRLPEELEQTAPRFPPPGLDGQDCRGRRGGGLWHSGRVPGPLRARPLVGHARPLRIAVLLSLAAAACANIPFFLHRWVWRHRRLEQLARLLSRKISAGRRPVAGDHRAGAQRIRAGTVARAVRSGDPGGCPRRRAGRFQECGSASPPSALAVAGGRAAGRCGLLLALFPAAAVNAWQRFLAPWGSTPRYTFTALEKLPDRLVVAHGEPFSLGMKLKDKTEWRPKQGVAQLGAQQPVGAALVENHYDFELPPQIDPGQLHVKIGDASQSVRVEPTLAPGADVDRGFGRAAGVPGHCAAADEGRAGRGGLAGAGEPGHFHGHGQPRAQPGAGRRPAGRRPRAPPFRARRP